MFITRSLLFVLVFVVCSVRNEKQKHEAKVVMSNYGVEEDTELIQNEIGKMYEKKSVHQTSAVKPFFEQYVVPFLEPSFHILDIGCGTGKNTERFLDYVKEEDGGRILGLDLSPGMVSEAKKRETPILRFQEGNALDLLNVVEEREVDLVFSTHTLHWIGDKTKVFEGSFDLLKEGGYLIMTFSSTNGESVTKRDDGRMFPPMHAMINQASDEVFKKHVQSGVTKHVDVYVETPEETRTSLEKTGFEVLEMRLVPLKIRFSGTEEDIKKKSYDFYETWVTIHSPENEEIRPMVLRRIADKQWKFATGEHPWKSVRSKYYGDEEEMDFFTLEEGDGDEMTLTARLECIEFVAVKKVLM